MAHLTRRRVVTTALATAAAGAFIPAQSAAAAPAVPAGRPHGPRPLAHAHAHNDYLHPRPSTTRSRTGSPVSRRTSSSSTANCSSPTRRPASIPPAPSPRSTSTRCWPGSGRTTARCTPDTAPAATADRHQDQRRRHLPRTRRGAPALPADPHPLQPRQGPHRCGDARHLGRPRRSHTDGGTEHALRLLRRPARRPGHRGPRLLHPAHQQQLDPELQLAGHRPLPRRRTGQAAHLVSAARASGQRVRFWATPDVAGPERDAVWTELLAAGVDHLNSDDLAGLEAFLRHRDRDRRTSH